MRRGEIIERLMAMEPERFFKVINKVADPYCGLIFWRVYDSESTEDVRDFMNELLTIRTMDEIKSAMESYATGKRFFFFEEETNKFVGFDNAAEFLAWADTDVVATSIDEHGAFFGWNFLND